MFINEIMKKIWDDVTVEYQQHYERFINMDNAALYNDIFTQLVGLETGLKSEDFIENIIATSGCSHRNRNGVFAGCTMCNWETDQVAYYAELAALRSKDKELYAKIILESFRQTRGLNAEPAIIEEIATHDILDPVDFPDEVFYEFFEKNRIFSQKPMYGIIATRASHVTIEKLKKWKSQYRKSLLVGMGVEVGDEWLRNYWINKNTSNSEIINAVDSISGSKCGAAGDILMGIPGLSEGQALEVFIQTSRWLDEIGFDTILISPLSRKDRTIQDFLYKKLINNTILQKLHVVNGELTCVPSLFTLLQGIHEVMLAVPGIEKKLKLSPQNFSSYFATLNDYCKEYKQTHPGSYLYAEFEKLVEHNLSFSGVSKTAIDAMVEKIRSEPIYLEYKHRILREKKSSIKTTLAAVGKEIAMVLWPGTWEEKVRDFEKELLSFHSLISYQWRK